MLAAGGRCVTDMAALRDQPALFGAVASDATIWPVFDGIDSDTLDVLRASRAAEWARRRRGPVMLDVDASLVEIHSENKQGAASHFKGGYGFHSDLLLLRRRRSARRDPAPGNAAVRRRVVARNIECSISARVSDLWDTAIMRVPARRWRPANDPDGSPRSGAQIVEDHDVALPGVLGRGWTGERLGPEPAARHVRWVQLSPVYRKMYRPKSRSEAATYSSPSCSNTWTPQKLLPPSSM